MSYEWAVVVLRLLLFLMVLVGIFPILPGPVLLGLAALLLVKIIIWRHEPRAGHRMVD